ncbi:hypothetical protein ACQP2P_07510 [Dactylosporangium sp. CA-139114]|uniref:hypothetical protein n=1 Tax=Dactylosporangium sp. CA-139114 TaxID=3239931 RepID=UPI003D98340E
MRRVAYLLIGLGVGLFAGSQLAASRAQATALWTGVAATVVGLVMVAASGPAASVPGDEGEDEEGRPTLSGLGTRVEQILRTAEEQAAGHLRQAEKDARKVRARVEAGLWLVLREGDDGERYEVARLESRSDADSVVAALEARGHLQRYCVAPAGG